MTMATDGTTIAIAEMRTARGGVTMAAAGMTTAPGSVTKRTRARRAVDALAGRDSGTVARLLGMKRHSIATLLDGRRLPGRTFLERSTRPTPATQAPSSSTLSRSEGG